MRHDPLAIGEIISGSSLQLKVTPVYPKAMLISCPSSEEIPALLMVDGDGRVSDVRVAQPVTVDRAREPFIDAVRVAARQWHFEPLTISHWAADASGVTHVVDSVARPFSRSYVFEFSCRGGKGTAAARSASKAVN